MRAISPLRRLGAALVIVAALVALVPPARAGAVAPLYYPQTGHTVGPHFTLAWRERGGVAILGSPSRRSSTRGAARRSISSARSCKRSRSISAPPTSCRGSSSGAN